ncbi:hypothetical protein IFM89_029609 [Coptis chinensis]|uniref:Endoglucanase n=1 Tax=Coptis chinensis TaxID=261450 RepID=A0A835ICE6_9MAGN|nr:hypothetical protein IFM89_029609 [Coptis chinensis]
MVDYGKIYPQQVHHRGSSIVSIKVDSSFVSCRGGYATWFSRKASDPNLLTAAIVCGPDAYNNFGDHGDNYEQTEPATYNNAPLLGLLASLNSPHTAYDQFLSLPEGALQHNPMPQLKPTPASAPGISQSYLLNLLFQSLSSKKWIYKGSTYYKYSNAGSYGFPAWLDSLAAGKSLEFVYVHSASPADISVSSYNLV